VASAAANAATTSLVVTKHSPVMTSQLVGVPVVRSYVQRHTPPNVAHRPDLPRGYGTCVRPTSRRLSAPGSGGLVNDRFGSVADISTATAASSGRASANGQKRSSAGPHHASRFSGAGLDDGEVERAVLLSRQATHPHGIRERGGQSRHAQHLIANHDGNGHADISGRRRFDPVGRCRSEPEVDELFALAGVCTDRANIARHRKRWANEDSDFPIRTDLFHLPATRARRLVSDRELKVRTRQRAGRSRAAGRENKCAHCGDGNEQRAIQGDPPGDVHRGVVAGSPPWRYLDASAQHLIRCGTLTSEETLTPNVPFGSKADITGCDPSAPRPVKNWRNADKSAN
jgi:hypothetical protein